MDNNLNVVPSIAKSWEISQNGKLYTFKIDSKLERPSLMGFPEVGTILTTYQFDSIHKEFYDIHSCSC